MAAVKGHSRFVVLYTSIDRSAGRMEDAAGCCRQQIFLLVEVGAASSPVRSPTSFHVIAPPGERFGD